MKLALLLVATAVADSSSGTTFTVAVTYQCSQQTPAGCIAWTQSGTITESTSCFPGDSMVLTPEGPKRMDAVQMGDLLLGHDEFTGMDVYSPVRNWLHRSPDMPHEFLKLTTVQGAMEVSRMHNVAIVTDTGLDYPYAEEITPGSFMKTREGATQVLSQQALIKVGVYAPLTRLNNFYVGSDASSPLLAHALAHVPYPQTFGPMYHGLLSLAELWDSNIHALTSQDRYVHPVASFFQDTCAFFAMDKVSRTQFAQSMDLGKSL